MGGAGVGEIAPPAARDPDYFGHFGAVVDQQDAQTALTRLARTKKPSRTCADDDGVEVLHEPSVGCVAQTNGLPRRCATRNDAGVFASGKLMVRLQC
jgi:hypothetical protein